MKLLDFHTHSTHSDGGDTPTQLVKEAKKRGVVALALTDHNVIAGLEEFNYVCKKEGIFSIPFGTEIYAELPEEILQEGENDAPDLIILGKNPKEEKINDYHEILRKDRKERWMPESLDGLMNAGFYIPKINIEEQSKDLGVPRIFHDFVYEKDNLDKLVNYVQGIDDTIKREQIIAQPIRFANKYLYAIGRPAYSKRIQGFKVKDAVKLADDMNCCIFIAHPGGEYSNLSDAVLQHYIENNISGIEIRSYFNTDEQNKKFDILAEKHNLTKSGGSDYHGNNGPFKIGMYDRPRNQLPEIVLKELKEVLKCSE